MSAAFTKRVDDEFVAAIDMRPWPMRGGETIVASNDRGALDLLIEDESGADVTAALGDATAPWITGAGNDQVAFWLVGGTPGARYKIVVTAPTSDGELLTGVAHLAVLP